MENQEIQNQKKEEFSIIRLTLVMAILAVIAVMTFKLYQGMNSQSRESLEALNAQSELACKKIAAEKNYPYWTIGYKQVFLQMVPDAYCVLSKKENGEGDEIIPLAPTSKTNFEFKKTSE